MKPYFETELGKLYHGDCLDVMEYIEQIGIVITSPPYNKGVSSGGGIKRQKNKTLWKKSSRKNGLSRGYDGYDDSMLMSDYSIWQKNIISALWSKISTDGAIYYNHKPRIWNKKTILPTEYIPKQHDEIILRQIVIWVRNGGINFTPTNYCQACEWIMILAKNDFKLKDVGCSKYFDTWYIPSRPFEDHPAPFPIELPSIILKTTKDDLVVLDPFMGSGTTALACENFNRKWIGIEISEKYCEIAAKRIEKELQQLKMFPHKTETKKPTQIDLIK